MAEDKLMLSELGLQLCRVCNIHANSYLSLFKPQQIAGELTTLAALLSDCANLQILESEDYLPTHICKICVELLVQLHRFQRIALQTDALLRQRHARAANIATPEKSQRVERESVGPVESVESADMDEYVYVLEETDSLDEAVVCQQQGEPLIELRFESTSPTPKVELLELDFDSTEDYEEAEEEEERQRQAQKLRKTADDVKQRSAQRRKSHNPTLKCQICCKQLSTMNSFKYHMQLHGDNRPFVCRICGESFKTRNAYDGHVTLHNPNNPNKCTICDKTYRQASSLRSHLLSHNGVKPFTCDICGKGLTQKSGYKKHMLTHTGEKPHNCDTCGRSFRYSSNLIAHKRSHIRKSPSCLMKLLGKSNSESIE